MCLGAGWLLNNVSEMTLACGVIINYPDTKLLVLYTKVEHLNMALLENPLYTNGLGLPFMLWDGPPPVPFLVCPSFTE